MPANRITVITRKSPLALKQTTEVLSALPGIPFAVRAIASFGDTHKDISLLSGVRADFFTRELDEAVLAGKADVAVHSAKDMPNPVREGLRVIALTKAADSTDCLVSRGGMSLQKLPPGARVGTSSLSRTEHLLRLRPDVAVVSVRGTIEERLALVDAGRCDALVVAACALKRLGLASRIAEILPFETHPLQGSLAVVAKKSRADLAVLFSALDTRRGHGKVYLVGAGAGSRELLTRKTGSLINNADILFYDDLIDVSLLDECCGRKVYVGKRKGNHHCSQDDINRLLYDAARVRQIVVRLKGGDPFIFGRGGEELAYLRDRYIDVEVVPGITAAQTAAASAGLPLTHRGVSDAVTLVSAHSARSAGGGADGGTTVYYMGASRLTEIRRHALLNGRHEDTPVALIGNAGFIDETVCVTTVKALNTTSRKSPLMVIAGPAAGLVRPRDAILFTGLDPYTCLVPGRLVPYPLIEIQPVPFAVDIEGYDGIVFTSRQAVHQVCRRYRIMRRQKLISIGRQTSKELQRYGYRVAAEAAVPDSDAVAVVLRELKLKKVLYPCSSLSDNRIHTLPPVHKLIVYKTIPRAQDRIDLRPFSGIVFSSPSTVDAFVALYKTMPRHLVLYVYGRWTENNLKNRGYGKYVQTVSPA